MRILVAEDSQFNRLLVGSYLRGSPHEPLFVENGDLAVMQYAQEHFDLILMDMQMPIMDGLTAVRFIRAMERKGRLPAIPIVALTATSNEQEIGESLNAGCNALISKPVSKQKLLETIEQHGLVAK